MMEIKIESVENGFIITKESIFIPLGERSSATEITNKQKRFICSTIDDVLVTILDIHTKQG